ncbi:MAG: Chaperone protein DnaJ [Alphaproteobacteria bacterium MarineAlpha5_Bin8]|nr:MAG: Chaperone protein DnaJ [Alphaproteobacteria bacterium MarineAlpha5_Bin7]PPR48149.1 MAG: Chaperone protein DnaJ [Alphaproteobacteria bacterium MarineAlpha5_Bin8]PPR54724.1 MAG: Chaperone protein DnaJ [Alphaproteobacteria bacterium MarineAlpha5_Bin6]|tara:strand:- start:3452 stop:4585 length:1134 start_codon:yes stop_codon:yes gene_type:complete
MAEKDFYEILGVSRNASNDEIKKSYRKLAMKYHPDRNKDDKASERKFKEVSAAYEVLKDPEKKAAYDQYGHDAFRQGGMGGAQGFGDFTSGFSDIFEEFFGGGFGGGTSGQRGPSRGSDLRYNISISLQDAFTGKKPKIKIPSYSKCDLCSGTGSADKSGPSTCSTCNGHGKVRSTQGFFSIERPCPSCGGQGSSIKNPCLKCNGIGQVKKQKTISVTIPAGVDTGTRIRISGEGEPGQRGANNGDLYIFVNVQKDKIFEREEENIFCNIPIAITTAILGGEIEVPTIEGKKARLTVPSGTQSETQFRLKGKGMSILRQSHRGDMYVEVVVEIPVNLTGKQKSILREFEKEGGTSKAHSPKSQSFFQKIKEVWEDLR